MLRYSFSFWFPGFKELIFIEPELMNLFPSRQFIRVVLPAPFGPIKAIHSPEFTLKEISSKIFFSLIVFVIFFTSIMLFNDILFTSSLIIKLYQSAKITYSR